MGSKEKQQHISTQYIIKNAYPKGQAHNMIAYTLLNIKQEALEVLPFRMVDVH